MPFSVLKDTFRENCYLNVDEENQTVLVEESDAGATLREIKIVEVGVGAFGIKQDSSRVTNPLFRENATTRVNQAVDGIIWTQLAEKKYTFVVELKSSPRPRNTWINKFHNAEGILAQLKASKAVQDADVFTNNVTSYFLFFNEATSSLLTSIADASRLNVKKRETFFEGLLFQITNPPPVVSANDLAALVN